MSKRVLRCPHSNVTRHLGAWRRTPSYRTAEVERETCVCSRGIQYRIFHFGKQKHLERMDMCKIERHLRSSMFNCFPSHQKSDCFQSLNKILTRMMAEWNILNVKPHLRKREKCSCASSNGNGRPTKVTVRWSPGKFSWSWLIGLSNIARIYQVGQFIAGK
jgi:hypothetical protein